MNYKNLLKKYGIFVVLFVLILFFTIKSENFLVPGNLLIIARQVSMLGIAAVGMAFVLLLGGIDLSIGSQVTLVNIVAAWLMVTGKVSPIVACTLAIIMTSVIGFINGFIIAKVKMPPIIVTLGTQIIIEGIAYMISKGQPIFGFDESFAVLGQGYFMKVPIPIYVMVIVMIIGAILLNKTYFGRYFYAVGGNEEASNLSGISVVKVKYLVYTLSGLFAGIAGVVMLSRTNSGQVLSGKGFEFDALTACVLGGVSINGGYGKVSNVVAGILILGVLNNGMVLLDVSAYTQMVIKGMVLLIAVGFDTIQRNRKQVATVK